ncbi:hypothetical protein GCM10008018_43760 [Paenibacillus marchantiophytorum]|uniref:Uncharacterized protein n=1 Tax=Paenibacillus marchantiophytorum TaxID=1619310 RepID=A0ABQ1EZH9_9BACL|nr:hypothetical protein [Paenibacillus marchantiophytorum]GFZ92565.1 hypothetical protein GCM10008018_43760 [Paenibacillus marchantiophytorum]
MKKWVFGIAIILLPQLNELKESEPWHFRYVGLPHSAIMQEHMGYAFNG